MKITEDKLNNIISKSINEALNEISYQTLTNAYNKSEHLNNYDGAKFTEVVENAQKALKELKGWIVEFNNPKLLQIMDEMEYNLQNIQNFANRKEKQLNNFKDTKDLKSRKTEASLYKKILNNGLGVRSDPKSLEVIRQRVVEKYRSMSDEEVAKLESSLTPDEKYFYENQF